MKKVDNIITLLPVRNEAWILDVALQNLSSFSDHIIIADQNSSDNSLEIAKRFSKVSVIKNKASSGHSNSVRWLLLDEARMIPGDNLIFCIDADEMLSAQSVKEIKEIAEENDLGTAFSLPWIQLWKSTSEYRIDGAWKNNSKPCAFFDDRNMDYIRSEIINDHTNRVPSGKEMLMLDVPLLHLQFAAWKRAKIKQAWYRCSELIASPLTAKKINLKYKDSLDTKEVRTMNVPQEWLRDIVLPEKELLEKADDIRLHEILEWFDMKGVKYFEPLQIWSVEELKEEFEQKIGGLPKVETYPSWLILLRNIKLNLLK